MTATEQHRLGKALWAIADKLRGSMMADDFRDYMLSFIFLRYLSEQYEEAVKKELGSDYPETFQEDKTKVKVNTPLQMWYNENPDDITEFEQQMRRKAHYVILPKYLWGNIVELARTQDKELLDTLEKGFKYIEEQSFDSSFRGLFSEINLHSDKLGKTYEERNTMLCKVVTEIAKGISEFSTSTDSLGDAYEYLIGEFAANSGQKAGEFYTPQMISSILSKIVSLDSQDPTTGKKTKIDRVLDFACGSGSLLLNVRHEMGKHGIGKIYGQEKNITTYNLARMNMLLHGVKDTEFEIHHGDSLLNDWDILNEMNPAKKMQFDAIVANPPFSYRWEPTEEMGKDFRFKNYGLAPKSAADFAFLLHGFHFLREDGTMAIILPHGVLFRGGKEGLIRKKLLNDGNIDAVIGLPSNLFYSTGIPVCILVLKKCKKYDDVLFINASSSENFEKGKRQNTLRKEDVTKIVETYQYRKDVERYSRRVSMCEIKDNDYNLNISRYVSTAKEEALIDLSEVHKQLVAIDDKIEDARNRHNAFLKELGLDLIDSIMEDLIKDAQQYILQEPQSKKDVFMALCSLNLLNAAIKKEEYKKSLSYGFIKPHVSKLLVFCISHINEGYVDELYYASQEHCVYIRCYGIQFSFHNIVETNEIKDFMDSTKNVPVNWDGIRLQPIADKLFMLAKELLTGEINRDQIAERFKYIIELA